MKAITLSLLCVASLLMTNAVCHADDAPAKEVPTNVKAAISNDEFKALYKVSATIQSLLAQDNSLYPDDRSSMRVTSILSSIDLSGCPDDFKKQYQDTIIALKKMNEADFSISPVQKLLGRFDVDTKRFFPSPKSLPDFKKISTLDPSNAEDKKAIKEFYSKNLAHAIDIIDKIDVPQALKDIAINDEETKKAFDICINMLLDALVYRFDYGIENETKFYKLFFEKLDTSTWPKPLADALAEPLKKIRETKEEDLAEFFADCDPTEIIDEVTSTNYRFEIENIFLAHFSNSPTYRKIREELEKDQPNIKKIKELIEQFREKIISELDTAEKIRAASAERI